MRDWGEAWGWKGSSRLLEVRVFISVFVFCMRGRLDISLKGVDNVVEVTL